jgi:hypothetical protein
MLLNITRLKNGKRGVSNVIVVMLSLVLVTIVVSNVILWSYQMNEFDLERNHEDLRITEAHASINGTVFTFKNSGSVTAHVVALWVDNSMQHQRYEMNLYVNSGDTVSYVNFDLTLPEKPYLVKAVTERGNVVVFS